MQLEINGDLGYVRSRRRGHRKARRRGSASGIVAAEAYAAVVFVGVIAITYAAVVFGRVIAIYNPTIVALDVCTVYVVPSLLEHGEQLEIVWVQNIFLY